MLVTVRDASLAVAVIIIRVHLVSRADRRLEDKQHMNGVKGAASMV
jgi:hypothetical protein